MELVSLKEEEESLSVPSENAGRRLLSPNDEEGSYQTLNLPKP